MIEYFQYSIIILTHILSYNYIMTNLNSYKELYMIFVLIHNKFCEIYEYKGVYLVKKRLIQSSYTSFICI